MATSRPAPTPRTSTRKPPEPKLDPKVVEDKPTFHFSIIQAEAEREEEQAEDPIEPFVVEALNGELVVFKDARNVGWQESSLVSLREPHTAVRTLLDDEYVDTFYAQGDFPVATLTKMLQAWMTHYGVTPPGN